MTDADETPTTAVCPSSALAADRCRVVGAGAAVVVMTGDGPRAFANRCPHNDLPLDGAWIRDGMLTCPHHFWRFDVTTGSGRTTADSLTSLPVAETAGQVRVALPSPMRTGETFRQRQLRHAREWRRDRS